MTSDKRKRFTHTEGVLCYEAKEDGTLTLYIDAGADDSDVIVIPDYEVSRMMVAGIDALKKKASRR